MFKGLQLICSGIEGVCCKIRNPFLTSVPFLQPHGAEDAGDGDAAPRGAGDAEAGEGKPPDLGGEAERGYPGAGNPAEPRHGKQHSPAEAAAGDDGYRPQPAQPLL